MEVVTMDIARETAQALRKLDKKIFFGNVLTWLLEPCFIALHTTNGMPNAHRADKETLSFYLPRPLVYRLRKKAKARGETLTDFLISIFTQSTKDVELTSDDYEEIREATKRAEEARGRRASKLADAKGS